MLSCDGINNDCTAPLLIETEILSKLNQRSGNITRKTTKTVINSNILKYLESKSKKSENDEHNTHYPKNLA